MMMVLLIIIIIFITTFIVITKCDSLILFLDHIHQNVIIMTVFISLYDEEKLCKPRCYI